MYGEVEDIGVDQSILKWIFNKLDGNVDCIDPSHHRNKWQGSCERFCLVLRFRNKWRYTSTPTPSWSWINKLNIFTSQKTRVPIIKPDRLKLIIQKFVLNPEIHFVREKQSVSEMCRRMAHCQWVTFQWHYVDCVSSAFRRRAKEIFALPACYAAQTGN